MSAAERRATTVLDRDRAEARREHGMVLRTRRENPLPTLTRRLAAEPERMEEGDQRRRTERDVDIADMCVAGRR